MESFQNNGHLGFHVAIIWDCRSLRVSIFSGVLNLILNQTLYIGDQKLFLHLWFEKTLFLR